MRDFSKIAWLLLYFSSFLSLDAFGDDNDFILSLPNQHPLESYHRRLLPEAPGITAQGETKVAAALSWSNTYNSRKAGYFVDSETRELTVRYYRGIAESLTLTADVGIKMTDAGIADSFIRSWDQAIGASVGRRDNRGKNRYFVEAQKRDGTILKIEREPFGLTDIRVGTRYSLFNDKESQTQIVLGTDLTLPTHWGTYGQDSFDLRYSLIALKKFDVISIFGNFGASLYGDRQEDGLDFDSSSLDAVLGALVNISENWVFQINQMIQTTDQKNIKRYPSWTSYLDFALHYRIDSNMIASVGVRENPINGQETTDVSGIAGVRYVW